MAKKKKFPKIQKVDPRAISIRSMAVSYCTVLCDESNLEKFNKAGFDLAHVAFSNSPKNDFNKLRRWAGRGNWAAVASTPEILDSDGVPGLDLVILDPPKKSKSKTTKVPAPKKGTWFDPVTSLINLPTGQLRVVYEDEFFQGEFDQNTEMKVIESGQDGVNPIGDFSEPSSYLILCDPGLYQAHIYTRFSDEMSDDEPPAGSADLAIYLTPIEKPTSFKMSVPLLPIHPATQDVVALKRKAAGLPGQESPIVSKPQLTKEGNLSTNVTQYISIMRLDAANKLLKKMGVKPGAFISLDVGGKTIRGLASAHETPDPSVWEVVEKEKKKPGSFAMFVPSGDYLNVHILKQGRKDQIKMVVGESASATISIEQDENGKPRKIEMKQTAVNHPEAVQVPKSIGKAGKKVEKLIPLMGRCFSWSQVCVFERDGKTMAAVVHVQPPQYEDSKKTKEIMSGEVAGIIGSYQEGYLQEDRNRKFRGYPDGIAKAFNWVAAQTKAGWVWTNRYELDMDFWNQSGKKPDESKAKLAAIDAWKEVLGID